MKVKTEPKLGFGRYFNKNKNENRSHFRSTKQPLFIIENQEDENESRTSHNLGSILKMLKARLLVQFTI